MERRLKKLSQFSDRLYCSVKFIAFAGSGGKRVPIDWKYSQSACELDYGIRIYNVTERNANFPIDFFPRNALRRKVGCQLFLVR
jgi:hypothetical protein